MGSGRLPWRLLVLVGSAAALASVAVGVAAVCAGRFDRPSGWPVLASLALLVAGHLVRLETRFGGQRLTGGRQSRDEWALSCGDTRSEVGVRARPWW